MESIIRIDSGRKYAESDVWTFSRRGFNEIFTFGMFDLMISANNLSVDVRLLVLLMNVESFFSADKSPKKDINPERMRLLFCMSQPSSSLSSVNTG